MKIEDYKLEKDISTFGVMATSFPEGILKAHQTLHSLLLDVKGRNFFGVSRPNEKGSITYIATVEEKFEGEAEKFNCHSLLLKKGNYTSIFLKDYAKNMEDISTAFDILLKDPRIDTQGYCVESYLGEKDLRCMVRLQNN